MSLPRPDRGGGAGPLGDVVLRPVRGHHAFEGCVEQLATAIRLGVFPLGSALPPERDLAERMGVSRATLREAIAGLRAAGMVSTTRGRGGGTVVSYRPRGPAKAGRRASPDRRERAARLAGLPARGRAGRLLRRGEPRPDAPRADAADHGAGRGRRGRGPGRRTARRTRGCTWPSPASTASPMTDRGGHRGAGPACTTCSRPSRCSRSTSSTPAGSTARSSRRSSPGEATKARRAMEQHCDDTAALLRGLLG